MASTSGSERDSEEQWDDMAIVRAFEEALTDQRSRGFASAKATGRKHKAASRSNGKKAARSVSLEEGEDEEEGGENQHEQYGHAAASAAPGVHVGMYGQPNPAAYGVYPTGSAYQQGYQQQQPSNDVYQAAYAQAYAQLQAQFQPAYGAAPQTYGTTAPMPTFPAQSPYHPSAGSAGPPTPPMPFPGMPGAPAAPFPPSGAGSDDGLANVLMAWYQSGYYTGRFQAMQEMKMRGQR